MDKNRAETKRESEKNTVTFTTRPEPVKNFRVENSTPNSLTVKWDASLVNSSESGHLKYNIMIDADFKQEDDPDK